MCNRVQREPNTRDTVMDSQPSGAQGDAKKAFWLAQISCVRG
jgi:hypothetical protein